MENSGFEVPKTDLPSSCVWAIVASVVDEQSVRTSRMSNTTKMQLFIDKLSQPSRSVLWYCLNENVPDVEVKIISIGKMEHRSEEFRKMYVVYYQERWFTSGQQLLEGSKS